MKNVKNWGLIGVSIGLAVIAAWAANMYLSTREAEIKAALAGKEEQVVVVVPTADLRAGDVIHGGMVARRPMPKDLAPVGYISPDEFQSFEGLTLKEAVPKGSPLLRHLLAGATADDTFSALLKKDERALTFTVDEKQATAHLLRAGDYVDVVLVAKKEDDSKSGASGAGKSTAAIPFGVVKQRAHVLATGTVSTADQQVLSVQSREGPAAQPDQYQTITLAVPISELGTFVSAQKYAEGDNAQLLFLLRNPSDESVAQISVTAAGEGKIQTFTGGNASNGELNEAVSRVIHSVKRPAVAPVTKNYSMPHKAEIKHSPSIRNVIKPACD